MRRHVAQERPGKFLRTKYRPRPAGASAALMVLSAQNFLSRVLHHGDAGAQAVGKAPAPRGARK